MRGMVALAIGASLIWLSGCVPDTVKPAFSSIHMSQWSIDVVHPAPHCYVDPMLDRGCAITSCLPLAGWHPIGGIGYTDCFSSGTTEDGMDG